VTSIAHPGDSLSRGQRVVYIVALGLLVALGPFTVDLYLPAFPSVARELSTSDAAVQLTLTATSIGFAVGQLVVGPWSDRIGRRTPLLIATAVHILASLGVALAPSVEVLTFLRIAQGIGAAGGGVVALAVVRDLFGGQPLIRMLLVVDWRGIFVALAAYGALVLAIAALLITETLPPERRGVSGHNTMRARYRALYTDRVFVGLALIGGMVFSALFVYLSSSSFLFQTIYGFTAQQFGLLFGVNSIGLALASQTSSRVMRRVAPQWVLATAISIMLVASALIGIFHLLGFGLLSVEIPLFFVVASFGLGFPSIQVLALAHHGQEAGTAASLLGAVNAGLAGIISPVVGLIGITSALPMSAVMVAVLIIAQIILWTVVRPRTVPSIGY
jgi:DHA1 family bicyclomycin/chloramphenicol resistance-like MFS transporter